LISTCRRVSSNIFSFLKITIWLNGGPGCSSLDGLLQENGPFLWQSGVYEPVRNPYSWTNLTNLVYIDQPASTGFSPGPSTVENEIDVSNQFNDFWVRFIETFSMQGYKIYITGESYAGQYIPYLADGMLNRKDTTYFNLKGIQINDPSINEDNVMIYGQLLLYPI
jgi:carboxypeptidase D